jgi:hypothetical protein
MRATALRTPAPKRNELMVLVSAFVIALWRSEVRAVVVLRAARVRASLGLVFTRAVPRRVLGVRSRFHKIHFWGYLLPRPFFVCGR